MHSEINDRCNCEVNSDAGGSEVAAEDRIVACCSVNADWPPVLTGAIRTERVPAARSLSTRRGWDRANMSPHAPRRVGSTGLRLSSSKALPSSLQIPSRITRKLPR